MRGVVICLILFLASTLSGSPFTPRDSVRIARSERFIAENDYYKAVRVLSRLVKTYPGNPDAILLLARAYCLIPDREPAFTLLKSLLVNDSIFSTRPDVVDFYINELALDGRFEIARTWQERKAQLDGKLTDTSSPAGFLFKDTTYFEINNLLINTPDADFCPVLYKSGLIYYTAKTTSGESANVIGESPADLFYIPADSAVRPEAFNQLFGYGRHEGSFIFFDHWQKMFLTKYIAPDQLVAKSDARLTGLKLYTAEVDTTHNLITSLEQMVFNLHGFSMAHPAISANGQQLFFVSNIPGGYGGADIYSATWNGYEWSPPTNLGPEINSAGDEYFPYIYSDSILFFTSSRPGGLGGLDIYKASLGNQVVVTNMGKPVNSTADDFSLLVDQAGRNGYFVSNRTGGMGAEDIYTFRLVKISAPINLNSWNDETIDDEAKIVFFDDMGHVISVSRIVDNQVDIPIPLKGGISAVITCRGFSKTLDLPEQRFDFSHPAAPIEIDAEIARNITAKPVNIRYRVQIAATLKPVPATKFPKIYKGKLPVSHYTEGDWNKYYIAEFDNYFEANLLKQSCGVPDAFVAAYTDTARIPIMEAIGRQYTRQEDYEIPNLLRTVSVPFAYNSAKTEADLPELMVEAIESETSANEIMVTIKAFTDSVGSELYNRGLAWERGRVVKKALLKAGIPDENIRIIGIGKQPDNSAEVTRKVDIVFYRRL